MTSLEKKKREPRRFVKETWRPFLKVDPWEIKDPRELDRFLVKANSSLWVTFWNKWLGKTMKQWLNYIELSLDQLFKYLGSLDKYPISLQAYQQFKTQLSHKTQTMTSTEIKNVKERIVYLRNDLLRSKVAHFFPSTALWQKTWVLINPHHAAFRLQRRIDRYRAEEHLIERVQSNPKSNHTMDPWPYARAELYQPKKKKS
jgi:hypothetical protein